MLYTQYSKRIQVLGGCMKSHKILIITGKIVNVSLVTEFGI